MTGNILENTYVALDLETTGLHPESDAIFEVGAVKFKNGVVIDTFQSLINPYRPIPYNIQRLCNISQSDVKHAPSFDQISAQLETFMDDHSIVGHNIGFDLNFLSRQGIGVNNSSCDTLDLARLLLPGVPERSLSTVADYLRIPHSAAHRALADAQMSREIFTNLINKLFDMDISVLTELQRLSRKENWWLGDLIEQLCSQRGATVLIGEAGLEKACFGSGRVVSFQKCTMPAAVRPSTGIHPGFCFLEGGIFERNSFSIPLFSHNNSTNARTGSAMSGFSISRVSNFFRITSFDPNAKFFVTPWPVRSHWRSAPVTLRIFSKTSIGGIRLFS